MARMPEARALDVHKALADDTRFRLYRYVGLAGRPVSVREMSRRLSLHPNTLRPHLRRLEEAGLLAREVRKTASVGRPQTVYSIRQAGGRDGRDYRLLAEMLCGLVRGRRAIEQAGALAAQWGGYLMAQAGPGPKPGTDRPSRLNLALLQEAMARAGFDPRFRRLAGSSIEVTLRDCPFRDLAEDHRDVVCAVHRGLLEGMLAASKPSLRPTRFDPLADGSVCRVEARAAGDRPAD
jgi:predicted ArsR family transcriptional regulator